MASCQTTRWVSTAPYVKLTVTENASASDGGKSVLSYKLEYISDYAAEAGSAREYSIVIAGEEVKTNTFQINGKTGTHEIATGTKTINKSTSAQSIAFSVTFRFALTWSGSYKGTLSASGSTSVPAKTSYTVQYNANGGSGAPSSQTKWYGAALTLSSSKPTRSGYRFSKWNTASGGSGTSYSSGATYTANAGATLYAQWTADTYTVSYDANGGSGAPARQTKTYGVTLKLQNGVPTRTNYNFLGWSTSKSATTATYVAGADFFVNGNTTLYAVWELAYTKPRISNLVVTRAEYVSTSVGYVASDEGTVALITFDWECDRDVESLGVSWQSANSDAGSASINGAGTSSIASAILEREFDQEATYTFTITVRDSGGATSATATMSGTSFPIDAKAGGDGISFGKPAELGAEQSLGGKGVVDCAFDAKFNQPVYGTVRGLDKLPQIPNGADFDNYMVPGCWGVYGNAGAETMANIPVKKAGCLEVEAATGEGVRLGGWSYLRQRYTPFRGEDPVYERDISRDTSNAWTYGSWYKVTLTPAASNKAYHTQKSLWVGALTMHGGNGNSANAQRITLSEAVSAQPNGIVLVFSRFVPSSATAENNNFYTFFVPKVQVANHAGAGHTFVMATTLTFDEMASKYLYINDTTISGNDNNALIGTSPSGIKYANNRFVLRYVIGV